MRFSLRTRLSIAVSLGVLLVVGVTGALARGVAAHHTAAARAAHVPKRRTKPHKRARHPTLPHPKAKKPAPKTKTPNRTPTLTVLGASTADRSRRGHLDEITIALSAPAKSAGLAGAFSVAGYTIASAQAQGATVVLQLVPHSTFDTGARPAVTVRGLKGANGATAPSMVITPADGAPPVLITASTADRAGSGHLDAINLVLSEPVTVAPGAIAAQGYAIQGTRDYPDGMLTVLLTPSATPDTAALPAVTLNGAGLRDANGNAGPSGPITLNDGAHPVMLGAQDEGFWLSGERVETIWSAPVRVSGPGAGDSFAMNTSLGQPIMGTGVSAGQAPNEIAVSLPLGAETPSDVSYTGAGGTVVLDPASNPGARSVSPVSVTASVPVFVGTLANPFSRSQMMPFGERSFYQQPWRSYIDTFPATRMLNAVGINFNVTDSNNDDVDSGARLLHDAGFTHARVGIPWNDMSYTNPSQIAPYYLGILTNELSQLKANGVKPLILLQSNDGIPAPVKSVSLTLTAPAAAGATSVQLDSASAAVVQPGLTGFYQYGRDGGVLITSVSPSDVATLSQPLGSALSAGPQSAVDLAFQPFFPQYNSDGSANATNQATLNGWLQYVAGVTQAVKTILGNDQFDVEVWNELTFGSAFLSASNYYSPAPQGNGNSDRELLQATVSYIRAAGNGLPDVGIGDGFTNEDPFTGGAAEVAGVTAIDKHPYQGGIQFPAQALYNGVSPLDALGAVDATNIGGAWHDTFTPTFTALLPEYFLSGIGTQTVTRDLAPFESDIYRGLHGRDTHPVGASAPQMWVTEVNADASSVNDTLSAPDGSTSAMSAADLAHFEAKAVLRYLASWVGKGTTQIDFFAAANAGGLNLIDPNFFASAETTHAYPGLSAGGATMLSVSRLLQTMAGAQATPQIRPLSLYSISDYSGAYQFSGNGTAAYPPLLNRNLIGFFPFQVDAHKWVIPTYVTTMNLATLYNERGAPSDVTRADLPQEVYRLTVSGVNAATANAYATDPISGASVPVKITSRGASSISLEIPLTDYPRMLTLTDG